MDKEIKQKQFEKLLMLNSPASLSLLPRCGDLMYMWRVKVLVIHSVCLTLIPQDCSPPSSSAHGILQASILQWVHSVQLLSHVWLFAAPWTAAQQASLSITSSWSLLKLMSIVSVMPSNHLILCHPLLFLPSICPSIRVFSDESLLRIRWPKYWNFSFSISPSNEHPGLIFRIDWMDLLAVQWTL